MPDCEKCGSSFRGYGESCPRCRSPKRASAVTCCSQCKGYYMGAGPLCHQCEAKSSAANGQDPQKGNGATTPTRKGLARSWQFSDWLDSLKFAPELAKRMTEKLDLKDSMLAFLRDMPDDKEQSRQNFRKLLESCDAIGVLADAICEGQCKLKAVKPSNGRELHQKFIQEEGAQSSFSNLSASFGGLEDVIGPPDPKLIYAMENEHCLMQDSAKPFTTSDYRITTTSKVEWYFAVCPEHGPEQAGHSKWPVEAKMPEGREDLCRKATPLAKFQEEIKRINQMLRYAGEEPLQLAEVIGLRLYTGPMFMKYNTLLRAMQAPSVGKQSDELCEGNTYVTTIHAVNSALVKLGQLLKATTVYRGVAGGALPDAFWQSTESGGVELTFLSTTSNRDLAMEYASSTGKAGTLLELAVGPGDRGADLRWISQYGHESEICFAPLCGLQVMGTRVEGSVLVVEARLSASSAATTLEKMIAKRHEMVKGICTELASEISSTLKGAGTWKPVREYLGDTEWPALHKRLLQMGKDRLSKVADCMPEDLNVNENVKRVINQALDVRAAFEQPVGEPLDALLRDLRQAKASEELLGKVGNIAQVLRLPPRCGPQKLVRHVVDLLRQPRHQGGSLALWLGEVHLAFAAADHVADAEVRDQVRAFLKKATPFVQTATSRFAAAQALDIQVVANVLEAFLAAGRESVEDVRATLDLLQKACGASGANSDATKSVAPLAAAVHMSIQDGTKEVLTMSPEDAAATLAVLWGLHPDEKTLMLNDVQLKEDVVEALAKALQTNWTLEKLSLQRCGLRPQGGLALAQALLVNGALKSLLLHGNHALAAEAGGGTHSIGGEDPEACEDMGVVDGLTLMKALGDALEINSTLEVLGLSDCGVTAEGGLLLIEGLRVNTALKELSLDRNPGLAGEAGPPGQRKRLGSALSDAIKEQPEGASLAFLNVQACGIAQKQLEELRKAVKARGGDFHA